MNNSAGVYTNMKGTSALPMDSRKAVSPVRIGSDPAMPAGCPSDFNQDGFVDDTDFVTFVAAYDNLLCP